MKCKFENCVFNDTENCQLKSIKINSLGICAYRLVLTEEQIALIVHKHSTVLGEPKVKAPVVETKPRMKTDELQKTLTELYTEQGMTISGIADKLNMSRTTVRKHLKDLSIPKKPS